jgi:hypothetical protein
VLDGGCPLAEGDAPFVADLHTQPATYAFAFIDDDHIHFLSLEYRAGTVPPVGNPQWR